MAEPNPRRFIARVSRNVSRQPLESAVSASVAVADDGRREHAQPVLRGHGHARQRPDVQGRERHARAGLDTRRRRRRCRQRRLPHRPHTPSLVTGKIVLCKGSFTRAATGLAVRQAGGVGMIPYTETLPRDLRRSGGGARRRDDRVGDRRRRSDGRLRHRDAGLEPGDQGVVHALQVARPAHGRGQPDRRVEHVVGNGRRLGRRDVS